MVYLNWFQGLSLNQQQQMVRLLQQAQSLSWVTVQQQKSIRQKLEVSHAHVIR